MSVFLVGAGFQGRGFYVIQETPPEVGMVEKIDWHPGRRQPERVFMPEPRGFRPG
jgi:hypothetical protein